MQLSSASASFFGFSQPRLNRAETEFQQNHPETDKLFIATEAGVHDFLKKIDIQIQHPKFPTTKVKLQGWISEIRGCCLKC